MSLTSLSARAVMTAASVGVLSLGIFAAEQSAPKVAVLPFDDVPLTIGVVRVETGVNPPTISFDVTNVAVQNLSENRPVA